MAKKQVVDVVKKGNLDLKRPESPVKEKEPVKITAVDHVEVIKKETVKPKKDKRKVDLVKLKDSLSSRDKKLLEALGDVFSHATTDFKKGLKGAKITEVTHATEPGKPIVLPPVDITPIIDSVHTA